MVGRLFGKLALLARLFACLFTRLKLRDHAIRYGHYVRYPTEALITINRAINITVFYVFCVAFQ